MGGVNGYVVVPPEHPLCGKGYSESMPVELRRPLEDEPIGGRGIMSVFTMDLDNPRISDFFDVHGSITFADEIDGEWCYGFDTLHLDDTPENWNEERTSDECERFAEQLASYSKEVPA